MDSDLVNQKKQPHNGPKEDTTCDHLELKTANFNFTPTEVSTIRKLIHKKYPVSMQPFVESVRKLMSSVQDKAKPKVYFEASLIYNQDHTRYRIVEALYTKIDNQQNLSPAVIAVEALSKERRDNIRADTSSVITDGVPTVMKFLSDVKNGESSFADCKSKSTGIAFKTIAFDILSFFDKLKKDLVIYKFEIIGGETPSFYIEIGHVDSQSYFLVIAFQLEWIEIDTDSQVV